MGKAGGQAWPRSKALRVLSPALVLLALLAAGCGDEDPLAGGPGSGGGAGEAPPSLSDGQILQVALTTHAAVIEPSALAFFQSTDAEAKGFAERMVREHSALEQQLQAIGSANGIAAATSPLDEQLRGQMEQTQAGLGALAGPEFDRAYLQSQVGLHQQSLQLLDTTLIPRAIAPDLRSGLLYQRAVVEQHLTAAQTLLDALADQATPSSLAR